MQLVVGLLKVGKELVKPTLKRQEKVLEYITTDLVDNGNLVDVGFVISSRFHSEMDQNV